MCGNCYCNNAVILLAYEDEIEKYARFCHRRVVLAVVVVSRLAKCRYATTCLTFFVLRKRAHTKWPRAYSSRLADVICDHWVMSRVAAAVAR